MTCKSFTLNGIATPCKDNMGGIKEVYIAKSTDVDKVELNSDGSQIQKITMISGGKFQTYKFHPNTANMTSTASSDATIGNFSVTTELALQFSKMETNKRLEIMAMCLEDVKVIVLDRSNRYWYLGYDFDVTVTAATAQTGTAIGDFNGYNVTLTDTSAQLPFEVPAEIIADIIHEKPLV